MAECRHCGAALEAPYRFCPMCATPLTDEATKRLKAYVEGGGSRTGSDRSILGIDPALESRLRYAVGYVAIVAGLATVVDVGGVFLLLGGIAVLPPVQDVVERQLDQQLGARPTFGAAGSLLALGLVVLVIL